MGARAKRKLIHDEPEETLGDLLRKIARTGNTEDAPKLMLRRCARSPFKKYAKETLMLVIEDLCYVGSGFTCPRDLHSLCESLDAVLKSGKSVSKGVRLNARVNKLISGTMKEFDAALARETNLAVLLTASSRAEKSGQVTRTRNINAHILRLDKAGAFKGTPIFRRRQPGK